MTLKLPAYAWLALAPLVALLAFIGGRELRPNAADSFAYDLDAPGYEAAVPAPGMSRGGFTGFGAAGGIDGNTLVAGRVTALGAESLTVETESGAGVPVRVTGSSLVRRLEPATLAMLRPGMTIVARKGNGDEVTGILILSSP